MKPFVVKTQMSEAGFHFFRIRIDGRDSSVSIDPMLVEQLDAILGSSINTREWINHTASRVHLIIMANLENGKKRGGLSRMVSREGWRFVLDPDYGHLDDLKKLGRTHPLMQWVSKNLHL